MSAATAVRGWFKVFASPVAHLFPNGIDARGDVALCGVIATRPAPWFFAPPSSDRCATCAEGARP